MTNLDFEEEIREYTKDSQTFRHKGFISGQRSLSTDEALVAKCLADFRVFSNLILKI